MLVFIQVREHGARLAGLEIEGKFVEHFVVGHLLEDRVELISIDPVRGALRSADQTSATMVDEVHENLRVLVGLESGPVGVVTEKNVKEVLLVDCTSSVVDLVFDIDVSGINFDLSGR